MDKQQQQKRVSLNLSLQKAIEVNTTMDKIINILYKKEIEFFIVFLT